MDQDNSDGAFVGRKDKNNVILDFKDLRALSSVGKRSWDQTLDGG